MSGSHLARSSSLTPRGKSYLLLMAIVTTLELIELSSYVCLVYLVLLSGYRLYWSPLAKFPGPRLAAVTLWYEFYYDVVKRGRYTWKIAELHAQYGPPPIEYQLPCGRTSYRMQGRSYGSVPTSCI